MRFLVTCLLLIIGWTSASHAQTIPGKTLKIYNNSNAKLFVVVESGKRDIDEWLQAIFNVTDDKNVYKSTKVYRVYVNETRGIPAKSSVEVTLPFYSRLVQNPDGTKVNQYIDWWNGGRIYLYDDQGQIFFNYSKDAQGTVVPLTAAPCTTDQGDKNCVASRVFSSEQGLPPGDHSQLLEYTFGDAITADGKPYRFEPGNVGYNISSVDQVYLPVAMQPVNNRMVPYIGTVIPIDQFRTKMRLFLDTYVGWPIYNDPSDPKRLRPRIPEAHIIFANTSPTLLTPSGKAIQDMVALYRTCTGLNPGSDPICVHYNKVLSLLAENFKKFQALPCHDLAVKYDEKTVLTKLYGWVPFNEGCGSGANALKDTFGEPAFPDYLNTYIHQLQYGDPRFNPYVKLIHDVQYLHMAAYAFSVDDATGFQHYRGDGLIIAFAGDNGLDNKQPLDKAKRVVVTLGTIHAGVAEWARVGVCSNEADYQNVDPKFASVEFYPPSYPCMFTATDLAGRKYQLLVQSGPPNLAKTCTDVANPSWCGFAEVVGPNNINTRTVNGGPLPSTHDFNGDGKSDILLRHVNGDVATWLMNSGQVLSSGVVGNVPNAWSIVGQRDWDADGKVDLLWRNTTNGDVFRWFINGSKLIKSVPLLNLPLNFNVVGTGDFNGDGLGDILWRDQNGGLYVYLLNSIGIVDAKGLWGVPLDWSVAGIGDFNHDGRSDILLLNTDGALMIFFIEGVLVKSAETVGNVSTDWSVVGTGDFNGDGFADILWRDTGGNTSIFLMDGGKIAAQGSPGSLPISWAATVTGDFNYDGKSDILWRDNGGNLAIWLMDGLKAQSISAGSLPAGWTIQSANAD